MQRMRMVILAGFGKSHIDILLQDDAAISISSYRETWQAEFHVVQFAIRVTRYIIT